MNRSWSNRSQTRNVDSCFTDSEDILSGIYIKDQISKK